MPDIIYNPKTNKFYKICARGHFAIIVDDIIKEDNWVIFEEYPLIHMQLYCYSEKELINKQFTIM